MCIRDRPTKKQLEDFTDIISSYRELPEYFAEDMIIKAPSANIMNKLARSVLALYSYDENPDSTALELSLIHILFCNSRFKFLMKIS